MGLCLALPLLFAACGGDVSGGGGQGGSSAMSLAGDGLIQNDCAPDDGAAIAAHIGTASACGMPPGSAPQAYFLAYPADVATLAAGDAWTYVDGSFGELSIGWLPAGAGGQSETVKSGALEILSATATSVEVEYSFETMDGAQYSGTATLEVCASTPMCG